MSTGKPLSATGQKSFVKERLIWASKPLGLLLLLVWVFHPATAGRTDYLHMLLLGFLAGTAYGLTLYGAQLRSYVTVRTTSHSKTPNRVPSEYYWGNIESVMYDNK